MKRDVVYPALMLIGNVAFAACEIDVGVGDSLEYSTKAIEVEASCDTITINLNHSGSLPANAMGHNWVLSLDADYQAIAAAGIGAGLEADYLPDDDDRIIAATRIIGGGESTSVSFSLDGFDPSKSYRFFCSFPGHSSIMNGTFTIA